jgi:hypothetical protein
VYIVPLKKDMGQTKVLHMQKKCSVWQALLSQHAHVSRIVKVLLKQRFCQKYGLVHAFDPESHQVF